MRALILTVALFSVLCGSQAMAASCPSAEEFQNKNNYYQSQALSIMKNPDSVSTDYVNNLANEQTKYYDSILPGCIAYFKTSNNPDCSKLKVLATGYMISSKDKQANYKSQVLGLKPSLLNVCKSEATYMYNLIK